jgi:hypothetical protein
MKRARPSIDYAALDFSQASLLALPLAGGGEASALALPYAKRCLLLASCAGPLPPSAALAAALGGAASVAGIEERGLMQGGAGAGAGAAPRALECAVVRFTSARAARGALAQPLSARPGPARGGLQAWLARAEASAAVDTRGLQAGADETLRVLDAAGAAAAAEKETLRARMQADGFTLVTRRSVLESEEGAAGAAGNRRGKKRTRPGGGLAPGAYAIRTAQEDKLRALSDLRKGYEEDRAHIARLAAQRKFNPF